MEFQNLDVWIYVKESGLLFKDVAAKMEITTTYLSRVLKKPLKPEMRARILAAVSELKGEE